MTNTLPDRRLADAENASYIDIVEQALALLERSKRAKNHDACTASTNASYRQPPSWGPMEGDEDEFVVPALRIPRWQRIWMTLWRLIGK